MATDWQNLMMYLIKYDIKWLKLLKRIADYFKVLPEIAPKISNTQLSSHVEYYYESSSPNIKHEYNKPLSSPFIVFLPLYSSPPLPSSFILSSPHLSCIFFSLLSLTHIRSHTLSQQHESSGFHLQSKHQHESLLKR